VDERGVSAAPNQLDASGLELIGHLVEIDRFRRADISEVSRPEIQHNVLALVVVQRHGLEGTVRHAGVGAEGRGWLSDKRSETTAAESSQHKGLDGMLNTWTDERQKTLEMTVIAKI